MSDGYSMTRDGKIIRLTLERPDDGNMLTLAMARDIAARIRDVGSDKLANAIVLRGAGDDFCKGRDPKGAPEGQPTTAVEMREALIEPLLGVYAAIRESELPVIAGVQGTVQGLGCGIAAICDITIAADNARFLLPEMRANLPPTLAMLAHLDRIPPKSLLHMVYSTDSINAARAVSIGLVSEMVPVAELDSAVEGLLEKLGSYEREAVATCKSYLQQARGVPYQTANDLAGNLLSVVLSSR
ncbi:MAG: enoyl-CoA hydratase/isomerase family protein [Rhodospirillaceae bacterium]|jgi:enoyl-CoA hydratase|nr:enoyl-CoA hydratase/isomerase family protein [Rhodospirillaceae bacterium]MBT5456496.1 enoyl-CoA hydratase/isomerase family protein [Rhodospirillaceae bacterium]